MPSMVDKSDRRSNGEAGTEDNVGECPICLDSFSDDTLCTLPCKHDFHRDCVEEHRKQGVQQACPICRSALPPGAEQLFVDALSMNVRMTMRHRRAVSGFEKDSVAQVVDMMTNAANQGHMLAQSTMGFIHNGNELGYEHLRDYAKAMHWYRKAADQGDAPAQCNLGLMYSKGTGVAQDYNEAMQWYHKAADQGDADAQHNLGFMYLKGRGVTQNYDEAIQWYRKAVDQGCAGAQCSLGDMYCEGKGVAQNSKKAVQWYNKAANQGHMNAQYNLGNMYREGKEVAQDFDKAVKCYRKAADQGLADAQHNLGTMYTKGIGVTQDFKEALKWYRKAADQGLADAQFNIGTMSFNGKEVAQDYNEAARWYRKAADQGQVNAQAQLGAMFCGMGGFPKDLKSAQHFLSAAEAQGDEKARKLLNTLGITLHHTSNEFLGFNGMPPTQCTCCGRSAGNKVKLKSCPRCKGPLYCGTDCQRTHWGEGHKEHCY